MNLQGKILPVLTDIRDFTQWSVAFMQEFHEVIDVWQKSLADDQKISKVEAQDIERELNDVLGALVFFYVNLNPEQPGQAVDVQHFTLKATANGWQVQIHKLPKKIELVDFLQWYQDLLDHRLRALFSEYLEAMADHVVSPEERAALQEKLAFIIKEVIYVIVSIRKLND